MKQLAIDAGEIPATGRQKQDKAGRKPKVGSGTNIAAMKITKSGVRSGKPVKLEQVVQVWEEQFLDHNNGDDEA